MVPFRNSIAITMSKWGGGVVSAIEVGWWAGERRCYWREVGTSEKTGAQTLCYLNAIITETL